MKIRDIWNTRLMNEAGAEGEPSGGTGQGDPSVDIDKITAELTAKFEAEKQAILAKNQQLLDEAKRAKETRREAERIAAEEARKKAEAEGNHEQLYKSAMEELEREREGRKTLEKTIESKEINSTAMKMAIGMNPLNDAAAEDLASHFAKRLKYVEGEIKVTDTNGNLTVSQLDDLKAEFAGSARYAHYLKGNQSSGGGASGGSGSGGATKEISRAEFSQLDPAARMKFAKEGGRVTD